MHLPRFRHLRPSSLEEGLQILKDYGPQARVFAGGTDLFPRMKYGLVSPEVVVSLKGIPSKPPEVGPEGALYLDALTTLADAAFSPLVIDRAPILSEAALSVGSHQIRQMGTLGGNICLETRCSYYNQSHTFQFVEPCFKRKGERCYLLPKGKRCCAVFCGDTAPALISLGALVNITGPEGNRRVPLEDLYTGDPVKPVGISQEEILTGVLVPGRTNKMGGSFAKFSLRGGLEFAALNVAVMLDMEKDGDICREARITVGAIRAAPMRMVNAEEALRGRSLSKKQVEEAANLAASEAHPFPHHGYTAAYLRECLQVHARRAIEVAAGRIRGPRKGSYEADN
jgi:4-hydroxybenzoyl-CoA reductase beta subunit